MKLIPIDVLNKRYNEHATMARIFLEDAREAYGDNLRVNPNSMYLVIKSAYDDIERYKLYHLEKPQVQKSNSVKRSAYLCKWINKLKPIEYLGDPQKIDDIHGLLVNAALSIYVCEAHITSELKQYFKLDKRKEYELIYDLTYREMNGDALLYIFQNIFDSVSGTKLVELV